MNKKVNFSLKPNYQNIKNVEKRVSNFFKLHGLPDGAIQAQIMILNELIKNGLKYGKAGQSENEITVDINIAEHEICLEVRNSVDKTSCDRLKELERTVQILRGYQDPFEAYLEIKKQASKHTSNAMADGFGLARIAYEGKAVFDFFVSDDNILNQSATRSFA
jgi:hypothetical protein